MIIHFSSSKRGFKLRCIIVACINYKLTLLLYHSVHAKLGNEHLKMSDSGQKAPEFLVTGF